MARDLRLIDACGKAGAAISIHGVSHVGDEGEDRSRYAREAPESLQPMLERSIAYDPIGGESWTPLWRELVARTADVLRIPIEDVVHPEPPYELIWEPPGRVQIRNDLSSGGVGRA